MNRRPVMAGAMLALLARANVPTKPVRMDMKTPYGVRASFRVFLNGEEQVNRCVEADAEKGYVVRHKFNAEGKPYVENGELALERIEGKVEFRLRQHDRP